MRGCNLGTTVARFHNVLVRACNGRRAAGLTGCRSYWLLRSILQFHDVFRDLSQLLTNGIKPALGLLAEISSGPLRRGRIVGHGVDLGFESFDFRQFLVMRGD